MSGDWADLAAECETDGPHASAEYFRQHAARGPALKPLGKPCHDCAVVHGLYTGFSYDLATQPVEIVDSVCGNWFCHDNPGRACRGNIEFVSYLRARAASEVAGS